MTFVMRLILTIVVSDNISQKGLNSNRILNGEK